LNELKTIDYIYETMVLKTWISDEEGQTFLKDEKKMR
jgi:hypothetical protein